MKETSFLSPSEDTFYIPWNHHYYFYLGATHLLSLNYATVTPLVQVDDTEELGAQFLNRTEKKSLKLSQYLAHANTTMYVHQRQSNMTEQQWAIRKENATDLEKFHYKISKYELYEKDDPLVDRILQSLATQPIVHVGE
ncbi:hypothetical protein RUM43_004922 [Polyplax serrata]|uniref:Uncharacterized protein n=1 Tax=Polyplax serrata TaxID=468196 RepID=A0AAN8SDL0_POLSC